MCELLKVAMLKLTLPLECLFLDSSPGNDCCSSGYVSGFLLCALCASLPSRVRHLRPHGL